MVKTLTVSQIPESLNVISRLHPKKLVKAMELQLSRNVQLHIRIVDARDANHFLIRVRHRFRTSASFTRSVCNAEFLQTILDLVLQLVDLILILELLSLAPFDQLRTETTSLFIWDSDSVGLVLD